MCGLTAFVTLKRRANGAPVVNGHANGSTKESLESKLFSSLDIIKHRGPDSNDIWINPESTIGLGHCRLSIVDLSPEGDQPLHDPEGHIHAVVIGEIYDDERLRKECAEEFGYKFQGHSDSELVLALYKRYGAPGFFEHLRGEFAFVLYDDRSGEVIAARDRFGIKPLYWTIVGDKLLIAPEMKAFLPFGWKPEWDVDSIALHDVFHGARTVFKNVGKILPAHYMTISAEGDISQHEYWDIDYPDKHEVETRSIDELVWEVREKLIESIRHRLRADVPVGIYLSGGLDSSTLAGVIKHLVEERGVKIGDQDLKDKIACFCISFDKDSGFDESDIAERTAKFLGVDLFIKNMDESELARHFEDCVWHNEHHTFDLNTVGKYALSELPRERGFKVILTGEGSDELFAGYSWFISEYLLEPDYAWPESILRKDDDLRKELHEKSLEGLQGVFSNVGGKSHKEILAPDVIARMNDIVAPTMLISRLLPSGMLKPEVEARFSLDDKLRKNVNNWSARAQDKIANSWHPMNSSLYWWIKSNLPNFLLTALGDRSEMAHSLEGRPPFLDHHLAEFVARIPPSLKMHYSADGPGPDSGKSAWWSSRYGTAGSFWEKWILREAAKPFITEELYLRRKVPYMAPVRWPRDGPLHKMMQRLITEENVEALGFVNWSYIRDALERGFGDDADGAALRTCLTIAAFVTISKRFGVAQAKLDEE
ncbi:hypothetical protein BX600DRAFT_484943 [Xylariales sp. PMI_506]|nr:hypothetical protein BX600DRAFT_484943 [Xylariales sp. PMI_506]